jgi:DNA-binding response OmpR family regulator
MPEPIGAIHILLVDDDPLQVQVREAILHDAGFRVTVATSAETALALLRSDHQACKVDAVITDHVLPGASGAEFVRSMRKLAPSMPIVVLTGMLTAEPEYQGSDVIFRAKPVPPADLIETLRTEIARSR